MHQRGGADIVAHQHLVERALADRLGGFAPQGIPAIFLQRLALRIQYLAECSLAGAVAEKALLVLQFDIEAVDVHRRQPRGAVAGDARCRYDILSHLALPDRGRETTAGEPIGFTARNDLGPRQSGTLKIR